MKIHEFVLLFNLSALVGFAHLPAIRYSTSIYFPIVLYIKPAHFSTVLNSHQSIQFFKTCY